MIRAYSEQDGDTTDIDLVEEINTVSRERVDSSNPTVAKTIMNNLEKKRGQLINKEDRETGDVSPDVYKAYLNSIGGFSIGLYILGLYFSVEFINTFIDKVIHNK